MALTDINIQCSNEEINRSKYIAGGNCFRRSSLREIKSETKNVMSSTLNVQYVAGKKHKIYMQQHKNSVNNVK